MKGEPQRKIKISRKLDGSIKMEIEGTASMTLRPDQAYKLAAGILAGLGVNMEYEWHGQH